MRKLLIFSVCLFFSLQITFAQDSSTPEKKFTVEVSDTDVLLGNYIEVTFVLNGGKGGKFVAPDWKNAGFAVKGGPNQSSSFSMINGVTKSTISYSYYVEPRDTGAVVIPSASIVNGTEELKTEPVTIQVFPNPDHIIETPQQKMEEFDIWGRPSPQPVPSVKPKKKRQTVRI